MKSTRPYRMGARAESAERTRRAVLDAAVELFSQRPYADLTLQEVAAQAGVTLQTVLRKFGSKETLFEAASRELERQVLAERTEALPASVDGALTQLLASYERLRELNWRALCQEDQFPFIAEGLRKARASHRRWLEQVFAAELEGAGSRERERRLHLLFAATDFYVWKLYRKDLGLSRAAAGSLLLDAVHALQRQFGAER